DLLSGTHTAHVWVDGPTRVRLALDQPSAEADWIRNGSDLWAWESRTQLVQHVRLPAETASEPADSSVVPPTPAEAARRFLDDVEPSTVVSVRDPVYVADRAAYALVLTPRSVASTVEDVAIAVDATTGLPLDVQVTAKGASSPAVEIGFTSVSFSTPPASTFDFHPPAGAT